MIGETDRFVIDIDGKDLKSITGKVKGRLQEHVRTMHRYPDATFVLHRVEGVIQVAGVPREALEEALENVASDLRPKSRFTYNIEPYTPEADSDKTSPKIGSDDELNERYAIWLGEAQREWRKQEQGYLGEIQRLESEKKRLAAECDTLKEMGRRGEEIADALRKDKAQLAAMYESVASQLVQPPEEASRPWVGDWSRVADKIDESLSSARFDEGGVEIQGLLNFTLPELHAAIVKKLPEGLQIEQDLRSIESLTTLSPFEETEEYRQSLAEYRKAKDENDYLEGIETGQIQVPESLKETLMSSVDSNKNAKAIEKFETLREDHRARTRTASDIEDLVARYKTAEGLRNIKSMMMKERPLSAVIVCGPHEGKWRLDVLLPSAKALVRDSYTECVTKAAKDAGLKGPDVEATKNLVRMTFSMPGNVKSWKDASRRQESFTWELGARFRTCPLHMLGVKVKMTKMMDLSPPTEPVEIDLPSRSDLDESQTQSKEPPG